MDRIRLNKYNNISNNTVSQEFCSVTTLKEKEIPQLPKKDKPGPTECTVREAMEDTKGFLFNSQLEGQFEKTTYCVSVLVFPRLTSRRVQVWRNLSESFCQRFVKGSEETRNV